MIPQPAVQTHTKVVRQIENGGVSLEVKADTFGLLISITSDNGSAWMSCESPDDIRVLAAHLLIEADALQERQKGV